MLPPARGLSLWHLPSVRSGLSHRLLVITIAQFQGAARSSKILVPTRLILPCRQLRSVMRTLSLVARIDGGDYGRFCT